MFFCMLHLSYIDGLMVYSNDFIRFVRHTDVPIDLPEVCNISLNTPRRAKNKCTQDMLDMSVRPRVYLTIRLRVR